MHILVTDKHKISVFFSWPNVSVSNRSPSTVMPAIKYALFAGFFVCVRVKFESQDKRAGVLYGDIFVTGTKALFCT